MAVSVAQMVFLIVRSYVTVTYGNGSILFGIKIMNGFQGQSQDQPGQERPGEYR